MGDDGGREGTTTTSGAGGDPAMRSGRHTSGAERPAAAHHRAASAGSFLTPMPRACSAARLRQAAGSPRALPSGTHEQALRTLTGETTVA